MAEEHAFCPVYASIDLLQEKWSLHIVRSLLKGPLGYNELAREIGCTSSTLAQRLASLEEHGIVTKTVRSTLPPRTSYRLTEAGQALHDVIDAIDRWGRTYLPAPQLPTDDDAGDRHGRHG